MLRSRSDLEQQEQRWLAPYAVLSSKTRGRVNPEEEAPYRTAFQRDRDRILHSAAFRRLEYKTQVFVNFEGDHYRTRLTHTLEATQIARSIARTLRVNEDLTEAVALVHDVGHPPFGHAAEDALHELMKDHGGFDHNAQGLRVIDLLEQRNPRYQGLNLSYEVREAVAKHRTLLRADNSLRKQFDDGAGLPLEAQIVELADDISYSCHDLDDGLSSGLLGWSDLRRLSFWPSVKANFEGAFPGAALEDLRLPLVRDLIDEFVRDAVEESGRRLEMAGPGDAQSIKQEKTPFIQLSDAGRGRLEELKAFLSKHLHLYRHYQVVRMGEKAKRLVTDIFLEYERCPGQRPSAVQERAAGSSLHRVICDYLASMTDRSALSEHSRLFQIDFRLLP
jgi:dGTPase